MNNHQSHTFTFRLHIINDQVWLVVSKTNKWEKNCTMYMRITFAFIYYWYNEWSSALANLCYINVNFQTHEKLVFCPRLEAITELKQDGSTITYKKDLLLKYGFNQRLFEKFRYARHMAKKLRNGSKEGAMPELSSASNR